jgi:hypothetical protein
MFTRSTPDCGTLDGPRASLAWAASLWPKLRRSEGSLGLMLPNERGQQSLASDFLLVYTWYIPCIYTAYIRYIPALSETDLLCKFELLSCYAMLCACISSSSNFHGFPVSVPKLKITETGICIAYHDTMHIPPSGADHNFFVCFSIHHCRVPLQDALTSMGTMVLV